jgi:ketosteroid isomerase-like protein
MYSGSLESQDMPSDLTDLEELKQTNQRFYDAFGALDIQGMDAIWETSSRALCVHPGWQPLVGWESIRASWQGIFDGATLMHFIIQYINVAVEGDCGWVTCVENITSVLQGRANNFGVLATNIFVRGPHGWRMIAHHASPGL